MEKQKSHTISPERLNDLKARLHRIPKQYIVQRNAVEPESKKAQLMLLLRLSIAAAASIVILLFLWPKEQSDALVIVEDVSSEMYDLGYINVEDLYSYVDTDSLEVIDLEIDTDIYLDYYNNLDYLEL